MTNNTLIRDISDPVNQLVNYNSQQIGFYDGFSPSKIDPDTGEQSYSSEPSLYIYINNGDDKFTVVRRKAGKRKVKTNQGKQNVDETKTYARAFQKYLDLKSQGGTMPTDSELILRARIAELEKQKEEEFKDKHINLAEKSNNELKAILDNLEVSYKGNASKETLLELIANNAE